MVIDISPFMKKKINRGWFYSKKKEVIETTTSFLVPKAGIEPARC